MLLLIESRNAITKIRKKTFQRKKKQDHIGQSQTDKILIRIGQLEIVRPRDR